MKLLLILLSVLGYHCCTGYPVVEDEILSDKGKSIEFWLNAFNETTSNDSSPLDMHGFFKKVGDKLKDDFDKIKDKIKDCKDILKLITFFTAVEVSEEILTENGTSLEYWFNASNEPSFNDSLPLEMHGFFKKVVDKVKDKVKDGFNKVKDKIKNCKDILEFSTFSDTREISEDLNKNETFSEYQFINFNDTSFNNSILLDGFSKKVVNKVKEGIKTAKDGLNKVKDKLKDSLNKVKDKFKDFKDKIGSKGGSGGGSGGGTGGGYYKDKYDRDYDRDRYDRDGRSKSSGGSGVSDPNAIWILGAFCILMLVGVVVGIIYYKIKK